MGLKFGGESAEIVKPDDIDDDGAVTAGEDLYAVLLAALAQASEAEQMAIAIALHDKKAWSELSQEVRDLFDAAGDAFEGLDE